MMEDFCITIPERHFSGPNIERLIMTKASSYSCSICNQYHDWMNIPQRNLYQQLTRMTYTSLQRSCKFLLVILTFTPWLLSRPCAILHAFSQVWSYALIMGNTVVLHSTAICCGLVHHNHTAIFYWPWMFAVHIYGIITSLRLSTFSELCRYVCWL
jgi:hypothetical protein